MSAAGYSETALFKKSGMKPGKKVLLIYAPENYLRWLGEELPKKIVTKNGRPDLIHLFAVSTAVFKKEMKTVLNLCKKNTATVVWVSWYKKSSGFVSDLSQNSNHAFALTIELVDIKVCAVSTEWSGLKLVVPLNKR